MTDYREQIIFTTNYRKIKFCEVNRILLPYQDLRSHLLDRSKFEIRVKFLQFKIAGSFLVLSVTLSFVEDNVAFEVHRLYGREEVVCLRI
jgi:hypothetical protein